MVYSFAVPRTHRHDVHTHFTAYTPFILIISKHFRLEMESIFFFSSLRMSFGEVYLMISTIKFLHSVVEYALGLGVLPIIHQKSEWFVVERNDSEEKFPTIFNESFNQPKRIEQTCNRIINNGEQS